MALAQTHKRHSAETRSGRAAAVAASEDAATAPTSTQPHTREKVDAGLSNVFDEADADGHPTAAEYTAWIQKRSDAAATENHGGTGKPRRGVLLSECSHPDAGASGGRAARTAARPAAVSERVARHPHPAFHQDARCGSSPPWHGPLAVHLLHRRADAQRAGGVAEAHRLALPPPAARLTSVPGPRPPWRWPPRRCPSSRGAACPSTSPAPAGRCRRPTVLPLTRVVLRGRDEGHLGRVLAGGGFLRGLDQAHAQRAGARMASILRGWPCRR
jgi:hypothetical protein